MKLRNKKTGEIFEGGFILIPTSVGIVGNAAKSVAEVNETWKDYEPKEPLIKDAESREIMRLWADRCGVKTVMLFGSEFRYGAKCICFGNDFGLEHLKRYTIEELCGTPPEPIEPTFVDLDERVKEK